MYLYIFLMSKRNHKVNTKQVTSRGELGLGGGWSFSFNLLFGLTFYNTMFYFFLLFNFCFLTGEIAVDLQESYKESSHTPTTQPPMMLTWYIYQN